MRHGQCGLPAPIQLRALGEGQARVQFRPPITVSCRLVAGLYRWIVTELQPAAQEMLGHPITRISGQTYSCRHQNHNLHLPLSEHAKANAIDITSFGTASGLSISVKRDWGPTERDLAEQRRRAARALEQMQNAAEPAASTNLAKIVRERERVRLYRTLLTSEDALQKSVAASGKTEAAFLRRVHTGACKVLQTVLGPEANDAHRDHFHLDMKERDGVICH